MQILVPGLMKWRICLSLVCHPFKLSIRLLCARTLNVDPTREQPRTPDLPMEANDEPSAPLAAWAMGFLVSVVALLFNSKGL